jgi:ABC-type transport system substrate-binding protein
MIGKLGENAKDFSDDELDEIIERLEGRRQARADRGQLGDSTQALFDDAARAAYELKLAADVTKRNAMIREALVRTRDEVLVIPLHHQMRPWAMKAGVTTIHRSDDRPEARFTSIR